MSIGSIAFLAGFMFGTAFGFLLGAVLDNEYVKVPHEGGGVVDAQKGE